VKHEYQNKIVSHLDLMIYYNAYMALVSGQHHLFYPLQSTILVLSLYYDLDKEKKTCLKNATILAHT
jgi:hypothetical protein